MDTTIVLPKAPEERTIFALSELEKLTTTEECHMSDLSKERRNKIAQEMYWTPQRIQGWVDGMYCQRSGNDAPTCLKIGIDDYSKGFRDGYYSRDD